MRTLQARFPLGLLAALLALTAPTSARPDRLAVEQVEQGVDLAPYLHFLEDQDGRLTLDEVRAMQLAPLDRPEPSFGFTRAAIWLHWRGENHLATPQRWLLEVAYPHLDHLQLQVVHQDGRVESREAGDMLPFAQRDVDDPNFVFALETAPHATDDYYLRIQTSGSARAPLKAWGERAFRAETGARNLVLALFGGAIMVLALFNLGVFLLIRQSEYFHYVLLLTSIAIAMSSFSGHVFQYVLPNHPVFANRLIGTSLALMMATIPLFARAVVRRFHITRELVVYNWAIVLAAALVVFSLLAPAQLALRGVLITMAVVCVAAIPHLRTLAAYNVEQARLYILSWHVVIYSMPIFVLRLMHVIPEFWLSNWIVHITAVASAVITSLALASRINVMKDELAHNVTELQAALASAELSAEDARRATRIKDDFLATMSHELRTPLNAIINVPQGLIDEFKRVSSLRCARCEATFALEAGERVEADAACDACGARGGLQPIDALEYQGEPDTSVRYLRKVERAGRHLLQMVNGVLDVSKMEAGRLELDLAEASLREVIDESVEQLSELARQKDLRVQLDYPEAPTRSTLDAFRIKQVLLNLLSNAFKFSEPGSVVTVSWETVGEADVVSVRDHGIGIAPEHHERIFAGFEQVHAGQTRKYGGTGLGLSISRSLVRLHGGELWVESALGQGAVFRFSLPRPRPAAPPAPSLSPPAA